MGFDSFGIETKNAAQSGSSCEKLEGEQQEKNCN
jgi:hypothetical protein